MIVRLVPFATAKVGMQIMQKLFQRLACRNVHVFNFDVS
jgi:hypothetical protein